MLITELKIFQGSLGTVCQVFDGSELVATYLLKGSVVIPPAEPVPNVPPKNAKKVLIDPGHSESEPGARSNNEKVEEEDLNRYQAVVISETLKRAGHQVDIYDPLVDDLEEIGAKAKGYDCFLSLHHNSFEGDSDPGSEVYITRTANSKSEVAAKKVCDKISEALGSYNRGVKEANFTVIATAQSVAPNAIVMLTESFFLNPYTSQKLTQERSGKAAKAIAEALLEVL